MFLALSHRPKEIQAFIEFHDALIEKRSGLTKADIEMIESRQIMLDHMVLAEKLMQSQEEQPVKKFSQF